MRLLLRRQWGLLVLGSGEHFEQATDDLDLRQIVPLRHLLQDAVPRLDGDGPLSVLKLLSPHQPDFEQFLLEPARELLHGVVVHVAEVDPVVIVGVVDVNPLHPRPQDLGPLGGGDRLRCQIQPFARRLFLVHFSSRNVAARIFRTGGGFSLDYSLSGDIV